MAVPAHEMDAVLAQLRTKALADHRARVPLDKLDAEHRAVLVRAVNNVLSTELAVFTYAQIIDGLPTGDVAYDSRWVDLTEGHPLDTEHEELCPGAIEKARGVCPKWDPDMLKFNPNVLNAFQQAAPGTKVFTTRLIELVAASLHQFGALLFQLDLCLHKGGNEAIETIKKYKEPKPSWRTDIRDEDWNPAPCQWPFFHHPYYMDRDIYPEGNADIVGYWAEDRILGGVVVFDRQAEESKGPDSTYSRPEPPNVYFHPNRLKVTHRIAQLRDEQQQALIEFLLLEDTSKAASSSPLPILVDDKNTKRFNWEDSIMSHHIYRDIWERRPLNEEEMRRQKSRPRDQVDYPESLALLLAVNKAAGNPLPEGPLKRRLEAEEGEREEAAKKAKLKETRVQEDAEEGTGLDKAIVSETESPVGERTEDVEDKPTEVSENTKEDDAHGVERDEKGGAESGRDESTESEQGAI
ncbi:hypothetical protein B0T21DRAFT_360638 [Apiosordaria backusii]|uniref:Uncharacterized protein n=1 Tax=Apiosordaria backusii TaxID=314023 RepID=A0AA40K1D4_9PEZI|nr:hypothetical protein B0T21DRAFT_360638 [Apiosordaria backusii]